MVGMLELLVVLMPFAFAAFLVWIVISKARGGQKQQADVQKEIVSKFASGEELRAFLKSDEGKTLFREFDVAGSPRRGIRERAISRIGIGIVLIIVGGGLLPLAHFADQPQRLTSWVQPPPPGIDGGIASAQPPAPSSDFISLPPGMGFPAVVLLLSGLGLILSSLVTLRLNSSASSQP